MAQRKQEKEVSANTFEAVAEKWYAHWKPDKTKKHAADVWRRLGADVFPVIGDRPISELGAAAFRDCVKAIESRGALDMAKRALQKCNQIMRYAVANDLAERNPVADVKPSDIMATRKKRNYSRIEAKDLPQLLQDIDGYVGSVYTVLALKLMALTFVRTSELIKATWNEIDFDAKRWNIPASRMKMRTPHIVPLSRQAMKVLRELQRISFGRRYVFPSDTDQPIPMSNNTILYALYRMGYRGRMTGHGFRGVASTILHEQGWPHDHIEIQLAHAERDETSAAYNHALYLPQRTKMMQAWGDFIEQQAKKVTPIRSNVA
jgi:integrase